MRDVPFFGELYRRTTEPLLAPEVTRAEGRYLREGLRLSKLDRVLDLGCGSGRHLQELSSTGATLLGVDIDRSALRAARSWADVSIGDLRELPFRSDAFSAAVCWYTTLFVFDEEGNRRALSEAARVLERHGGRLVLQTVNPDRLAEEPACSFERRLPDGSLVQETSRFDLAAGVDEGTRLLHLPDGEVLRARYRLRYYRPDELCRLLESCGLRVEAMHGSVQGEPFAPESRELVAWCVRG